MSTFLDIAEIISQIGEKVTYSHDLDGRLTSILDPALQRSISYDAGNRIIQILDGKSQFTGSYQHDKLDRLLKQTLGQNQTQTNLSYVYDKNSNRIQKNTDGTVESTPIETTSNKLTNITYDANGSITNDGTRTYSYNTENRLKTLSKDNVTANYVYNALKQRVKKQVGSDITYFSYDEQGKLVSELDKDGKVIREYIYLGNQPIGLFSKQKPNELLQIHTDHLGTPRAVTNANKEILWRWEGDAFGDVTPSIEKIKMPLRMAGQYYDSESGLFYNWHRYYLPELGRYNRVDDLGLYDGTNPFNYAYANALMYNDPYGLFVPPALPQSVVDFSAGFGDSILFGFGDDLRHLLNIGGVDRCSDSYRYGGYASLAMGQAGAGRATYILGSKAVSMSRNPNVLRRGSQVRNFMKQYMGPAAIPHKAFDGFRRRIKPWSEHVKKKGLEEARRKLGTTDETFNKYMLPLTLGQGARFNNPEGECSCD